MTNTNENDKNGENVKEDFCPVCLAVPLALMSSGAAISSDQKGTTKDTKRNLRYLSIFLLIIAIMIGVYVSQNKDKCNSCRD